MIVKRGNSWVIYNHDKTKILGTYTSHADALKRLREIEYFKHKGGG